LDVLTVLRKRKSVRSYVSDPVPDEALLTILEGARLAPSAGNIQPWHFIVIKDNETRGKIAKGCRYGKFLSESPVVIIACGNKQASSHWYPVDTAIALEHVVLGATAIGLGTCWIGMFNEQEIRTLVNLPTHLEIIALLALGYPREKTDLWARILHVIRPRKQLADILSSEQYGKPIR
jgi:nitroreductase